MMLREWDMLAEFRDPGGQDATPRVVISRANDYPASLELSAHRHRRGQLLYASRGTVAVSTPEGSWVAPPERGVWIPPGVPHAVRMMGEVSTRSVYVEPADCHPLGDSCRVLAVSPLLRSLLIEAAAVPPEYDVDARDGLLMRLLVEEIARAATLPLALGMPRDPRLASLCARFISGPSVGQGIDAWASALGLQRRTFTRLFRRETGMSFVQWRQQACLLAALPRLAAGESVTGLAMDLGYENVHAFSTMFRRATGQPPSAYRRAMAPMSASPGMPGG
jgi:AraC-like DNA-binding protein